MLLVRLGCRGDWISPHTQRSLKRRDTVAVSAVLALAERGQVDVPHTSTRSAILRESLSRSPDLLRLVDRTKNEGGVPLDVENREAIFRHSIYRQSRSTPS